MLNIFTYTKLCKVLIHLMKISVLLRSDYATEENREFVYISSMNLLTDLIHLI